MSVRDSLLLCSMVALAVGCVSAANRESDAIGGEAGRREGTRAPVRGRAPDPAGASPRAAEAEAARPAGRQGARVGRDRALRTAVRPGSRPTREAPGARAVEGGAGTPVRPAEPPGRVARVHPAVVDVDEAWPPSPHRCGTSGPTLIASPPRVPTPRRRSPPTASACTASSCADVRRGQPSSDRVRSSYTMSSLPRPRPFCS
jgi:hypothetical protein